MCKLRPKFDGLPTPETEALYMLQHLHRDTAEEHMMRKSIYNTERVNKHLIKNGFFRRLRS